MKATVLYGPGDVSFEERETQIEKRTEAVARIMELTKGMGVDSVLECVGTQIPRTPGDPLLQFSAVRGVVPP
jgi:threonine dehydrogenase-like Zn-dependent dehydrogenase